MIRGIINIFKKIIFVFKFIGIYIVSFLGYLITKGKSTSVEEKKQTPFEITKKKMGIYKRESGSRDDSTTLNIDRYKKEKERIIEIKEAIEFESKELPVYRKELEEIKKELPKLLFLQTLHNEIDKTLDKIDKMIISKQVEVKKQEEKQEKIKKEEPRELTDKELREKYKVNKFAAVAMPAIALGATLIGGFVFKKSDEKEKEQFESESKKKDDTPPVVLQVIKELLAPEEEEKHKVETFVEPELINDAEVMKTELEDEEELKAEKEEQKEEEKKQEEKKENINSDIPKAMAMIKESIDQHESYLSKFEDSKKTVSRMVRKAIKISMAFRIITLFSSRIMGRLVSSIILSHTIRRARNAFVFEKQQYKTVDEEVLKSKSRMLREYEDTTLDNIIEVQNLRHDITKRYGDQIYSDPELIDIIARLDILSKQLETSYENIKKTEKKVDKAKVKKRWE